MFEFSADTQYIFKVTVDGVQYLVAFSERNSFGTSTFSTANEKVAEKIRRTSMFRNGAIRETTQCDDAEAGIDAAAEQRPTERQSEEKKDSVKEFANITLAREWLSKTFGVKKSEIRYPGQIAKCAKENGVEIRYAEGR